MKTPTLNQKRALLHEALSQTMNTYSQTKGGEASLPKSWAARLWAAKEEREHNYAAVLLPADTAETVGFGVGDMAHRALDAACAEIGFKAIYDRGFTWPEIYTYDEAVQRDCMRAENERGDVALIYKL